MAVATAQPATTAPGRLPVPSRSRRPALAAPAILLVPVGALGSAVVAHSSGSRVVDVLLSSTWMLRRLQPRWYRDWRDLGRHHAEYPPLVLRAQRCGSAR